MTNATFLGMLTGGSFEHDDFEHVELPPLVEGVAGAWKWAISKVPSNSKQSMTL